MKTGYQINGWMKHFEEDTFDQGCIGVGSSHSGDERFTSDTIEGVIKKAIDFTGIDDKDIKDACLFDSCDEIGRLDVQVLEDGNSGPASPSQIESWKKGNCRLWASTYIFHVEKFMFEDVSISGVKI